MKRENAYFTVEAAVVLPIVFSVIVLLIYLVFFQYDRCLMEQDVGALALKGCSMQEDDKNALMLLLMQYEDGINQKKYIMWNKTNMEIKLEEGTIETTQSGNLRFPFFGMYEGGVENHWNTVASYENHRIDPVGFIRMYRKLTGGI